LGLFSVGCQSGGIGDPCVPEDEYQQYFAGYSETEVNMESRSFQCETRLCLVNHFRGRVSCPYGQTEMDAATGLSTKMDKLSYCHIPGTTGTDNQIRVAVNKQLDKRLAKDTVYCSCRCNGSDPGARYCKCPTGFQCAPLLNTIKGLGGTELAGSYCVKEGTVYDVGTNPGAPCQVEKDVTSLNDPPGPCGTYDGH
jgi:hypothetical protein